MLYRIPALLIAVTAHEYAKAVVSWRLGDNVPHITGRLTPNPFRHADPFGAACIVFSGYGWGRPVDTSPMYYANRARDTFIVYTVPSVINFIIALVFGFTAFFVEVGVLRDVLYQAAFVNAAMALFNCVPIYPLDGSRILALFMSPEARVRLSANGRWFQMFLVLCVFLGIVNRVFDPLVNSLLGFVYL
jgi:Zn-dependent protease